MLPKHPKMEIVPQAPAEPREPRAGERAQLEDRSLFGHLDALRRQLDDAAPGLDYNHLSFEEKQAALALVEAGEARFTESADGRTLVERHSPSLIKRFLS